MCRGLAGLRIRKLFLHMLSSNQLWKSKSVATVGRRSANWPHYESSARGRHRPLLVRSSQSHWNPWLPQHTVVTGAPVNHSVRTVYCLGFLSYIIMSGSGSKSRPPSKFCRQPSSVEGMLQLSFDRLQLRLRLLFRVPWPGIHATTRARI